MPCLAIPELYPDPVPFNKKKVNYDATKLRVRKFNSFEHLIVYKGGEEA
jgi:hypothetical protein